jgi:SAM-dependent methyltransferase
MSSYDVIPYESIPITDTHVETLAATARLFGVAAADPARCRVLELGCAEGGNLIPMAFYLPGSRFVGLDLSRAQVAAGQALIAELGLGNIELLHRDVSRGADDLGEFDYIIAHGLYSWVPAPVRERILALCARQLAPNGVAYISFNTLPGWRSRAMVRDMLLHHARGATAPRARLMLAYEFMERYAPAFGAMEGSDAAFIREEFAYLRQAPASYLYHEYLEETNEPLLFADFMAAAQAAGLQYVADTGLAGMLPGTLPEAARERVVEIPDRLEREQAMDFLRARRFRRTLLARAGAAVRNAPDIEVFRSLALHADLHSAEEIDLASTAAQDFFSAAGARFAVCHPLAKAAVMLLSARFPDSVPYEDLAVAARQAVSEYGDAALARDADALLTELFSLAAWQALRMTPRALDCGHELPAQPCAHGLAQAQLRREQPPAGLRHTAVQLDAHAARLLELADGRRDVPSLIAAMQSELRSTEIAPAAVAARCTELLGLFLRNGLLRP